MLRRQDIDDRRLLAMRAGGENNGTIFPFNHRLRQIIVIGGLSDITHYVSMIQSQPLVQGVPRASFYSRLCFRSTHGYRYAGAGLS